jgi:hypothetical protein
LGVNRYRNKFFGEGKMNLKLNKMFLIMMIGFLLFSVVSAEESNSFSKEQTNESFTAPSTETAESSQSTETSQSTGTQETSEKGSETGTQETSETETQENNNNENTGNSENNSYSEPQVCEGILGDVDGDGEITQNDVDLAFELVMTNGYNICADMNEDGVITAGDAQAIYALIPETCSLMGDVDGDGQLTCIDVQCIFNYVLGIETPECNYIELCGDINQDGTITAGDAQQLTIQEELNCNQTCNLLGDVDGDGQLTCIDVQCIFNLAIGIQTENCINPQCADINQDGTITAGDAQSLQTSICPNGTCNYETGVCEIETNPEEPGTPTSGGSGSGSGSSGGLRACTIEDIVYSEWSNCIDGIQSREYSLKTRCTGNVDDFLEELERTCIIENELIEFIEGSSCYDNNPCTKGRWYQRNENSEGKCVFDFVNGISCYDNGTIGVCNMGKCILPETTQQKTIEEITENTNNPTGFFGLSDLGTAFLGLIFLILIILGYAGYRKIKK